MQCYVLIGGASSRMGSPKADLVLGGRTFLERVTAAARTAFDEIVAVQRAGAPVTPLVRTIQERPHEGTAAIFGLERAMEDAGDGRLWLLALDYPLVTGSILADLRARWDASEAPAIAPVWDGQLQMLCAGWSGSLLHVIRAKIGVGDYRLRDVLTRVGLAIPEDDLRRKHGGEPLLNVNEPADLERARRIHDEAEPSRR